MRFSPLAIVMGTLVGGLTGVAVVYLLLSGGAGLGGASHSIRGGEARLASLLEDERNTVRVFGEAAAAVVYIESSTLRRELFTLDARAFPQGTGSGFLWNAEGYVVTNYHVIEAADSLRVTLSNGNSYAARVVGVEPGKDLAVLRLLDCEESLTPLGLGDSSRLIVGQKVLAIGNPFGLDQTLTTGIVSALGRAIQATNQRTIVDVIQTDAAINPGNSGGPLLDSNGRVIGINTALVSPSGSSSGIGFAVPVNTVRRVVPQLIQYGRVIRPGLGVRILNDGVARRIGVGTGVVISNVHPGSGADKAGLKGLRRTRGGRTIGDVIVAIGESEVQGAEDLLQALERYHVGDSVQVGIVRDGKREQVVVELMQVN